MRSVITGTGMYIPETSVDNHALAKIMDTSDEWIQVRTGIVKRQYAAPDQATSDLAVPACRQAIENAGLKPSDIDYVVFATMTPDYFFPGSAPFLQRKLGWSSGWTATLIALAGVALIGVPTATIYWFTFVAVAPVCVFD